MASVFFGCEANDARNVASDDGYFDPRKASKNLRER